MAYPGYYCVYKCETDRMNERRNISFFSDKQFDTIIRRVIDLEQALPHDVFVKMSDYDLMELARYLTEKELHLQESGVIHD